MRYRGQLLAIPRSLQFSSVRGAGRIWPSSGHSVLIAPCGRVKIEEVLGCGQELRTTAMVGPERLKLRATRPLDMLRLHGKSALF